MRTRVLFIALVALLTASCGGGDKHLPSSNPPEYDPKKVYSSSASKSAAPSQLAAPPQSAIQPAKPEMPRTVMPEPCEKPPRKPSDLEEPPDVCGGGSGGTGGSGEGGGRSGGGGGGIGGGEKRKSTNAHAKHPLYVLEFQSMIVATDPDLHPAQSQASGRIQLTIQEDEQSGAEPKYTGQGGIAYKTGPLPNWNACDPLTRGEGVVGFRVFQAFIYVEEYERGSASSKGGSAKIELLYGIIGGSQETNTGMPFYLEGNCVPNKPQVYSFWSPNYIAGRGEVATMPEQMFLLKDWTYVGKNGVIATKTLSSTCGGMCDQEVATFTLREGDGAEPASK